MPFIPTIPKPNTVWGTDVSFYQDENETPQKINFEKMFAAGASFTIVRAGQNLWQDEDFVNNWKSARGVMPRGAYFYLDVRASIRQQAKLFADVLREDMGELPPTVDFEQISNAKANKADQQLRINHLDGFLTYLKEYLPNVPDPMIYTGYYFWLEFGKNMPQYADHLLWIARYKADAPMIPAPWKDWTFWQFTDGGDGKRLGVESNAIDLNYFNGSLEDLYKLTDWDSNPKPIQPDPLPLGKGRKVKRIIFDDGEVQDVQ